MSIFADQNLYPGINPHLNSYLQNEPGGGWESFHSHHINHLVDLIDERLPAGYLARSEKSLQISELASPDETRSAKLRPDITILKPPSVVTQQTSVGSSEATLPIATIPVSATLAEEDSLSGLLIYQAGEEGPLGRPITRIELLSPANKPSGSYYAQYMHKRWETLASGLRLVEIDYLHENAPITDALANYAAHEAGAYPYTILVNDPRPSLERGTTQIYGFKVADKVPAVIIPLAGADRIIFDFGVAYNHTFSSARYYHLLVDYEQEPVHFERYVEEDRTWIRQKMAEIRAQYENTV